MCIYIYINVSSYFVGDPPDLPFLNHGCHRLRAIQIFSTWDSEAADARARGFLLGATAGRTTLNGEGLQHQDWKILGEGYWNVHSGVPGELFVLVNFVFLLHTN